MSRVALTLIGLFLAAAVLDLAFGDAGAQEPDREQVQRGGDIWSAQCATCHGELARGVEGLGPDIRDAGTAGIDFVLRTGRMPLENEDAPMVRRPPRLTPEQIDAVVAYYDQVLRTGGPDIPDIEPGSADLGRGRQLFVQNCAACHGPTAAGIAVGQQDIAPALDQADPIEIAEAVRIGPGRMPVFGSDVYTEDEVEAVTTWVLDLRQRDSPGGVSLGRSGPVTEGALAWILGMGALLVVMYLLGERAKDEPTGVLEGPSPVDTGAGAEHRRGTRAGDDASDDERDDERDDAQPGAEDR